MVEHNIVIHEQAQKKLNSYDYMMQERLKDVVVEVSKEREPTSHPKCKWLDGDDLLCVRVGTFRVLVDLDKTSRTLRVVELGERGTVYDNVDVALERAQG